MASSFSEYGRIKILERFGTLQEMNEITDHLKVDLIDRYDSEGFPLYAVCDFATSQRQHAGTKSRFAYRVRKKLDSHRETAERMFPGRPKRVASFVRWLYGFPMLPEHNETQEEYDARKSSEAPS
jgi:hypothetical protein